MERKKEMNIQTEKKLFQTQLSTYKKDLRHYLITSRFSNETWSENQAYRSRINHLGCMYCSPEPITIQIPIDAIMFILEMNNSTNKILGIGMVRNRSHINKYHVYSNGNYNRYAYKGKNRIDRKEMTDEEETIMKAFDIICFKGNKHMKRGQGLKSFPTDILYRCSKRLDLVNFISEMFRKRLIENKNNSDEKI